MRPASSATLVAALLLAAGCAVRHPKVEMEEPGRPAVTWQNVRPPGEKTPAKAQAAVPTAIPALHGTEQVLLAELHAAERKDPNGLVVADTLYNLAILRRQQGQPVEAEQLYRRALAIRERKQGANSPDVAVVLNNLAALQAAQGHYTDAQSLFERALAIREHALGKEHVLTAESLNNLALLYAAQGNSTAAEPLYKRAVAILEKHRDTQNKALGRVLENYAALLYDTGHENQAKALEARAKVIRAAADARPTPAH